MDSNLKFGISTTVLREHPISYALEQIAKAGYRSAEIWPWHLERWEERPASLGRKARQLGLILSTHAPAGKLNPTAGDPDIAREAQDVIAASLELAAEMGALLVAIHPGRKTLEEEPADEIWKRLMAWVTELDELAVHLGVKVGMELMENLPLEVFTVPRDASRLMEKPFNQIGLTIDIAHMNTHMDPVKFLEGLEPGWITHVHLSDNAPRRVHLPLGEGRIDLGAVLDYLESIYSGIVSIEGSVPGDGEPLLRRNMVYLRKLGWG